MMVRIRCATIFLSENWMLACDTRLYSWIPIIRMTEAWQIKQSILVWDKILIFYFLCKLFIPTWSSLNSISCNDVVWEVNYECHNMSISRKLEIKGMILLSHSVDKQSSWELSYEMHVCCFLKAKIAFESAYRALVLTVLRCREDEDLKYMATNWTLIDKFEGLVIKTSCYLSTTQLQSRSRLWFIVEIWKETSTKMFSPF